MEKEFKKWKRNLKIYNNNSNIKYLWKRKQKICEPMPNILKKMKKFWKAPNPRLGAYSISIHWKIQCVMMLGIPNDLISSW